MWMAGYGSRDKPSEGTIHDLWAKALVLRDPSGRLAALVTLDICGIGRDLSTRDPRRPRRDDTGWSAIAIVLACSHTHSGPVIGENLISMYTIDDEQRRQIAAYAETFVEAVVGVVGRGHRAHRAGRAELGDGAGRLRGQPPQQQGARGPRAPRADGAQGARRSRRARARASGAPTARLRAVVFGYACHCTVLSLNKFSGDYAGFAQIDLERDIPGAQAMFVAGCGADQNPLPRRDRRTGRRRTATSSPRPSSASWPRPMRPIADPAGRRPTRRSPCAFAKLPTREQCGSRCAGRATSTSPAGPGRCSRRSTPREACDATIRTRSRSGGSATT